MGDWSYRGPFPAGSIRRIATWSAPGGGVSTLLAASVIVVRGHTLPVSTFPSSSVDDVAAGGVLGAFFGTTRDLRTHDEETALRHGDDIEVWPVRWFTDRDGETIELEADDSDRRAAPLELLAEEIESTEDPGGIVGVSR